MSKLNLSQSRDLLQDFEFGRLFVEELGWSRAASPVSKKLAIGDLKVSQRQIAELAGVAVFEITSKDGAIPNKKQQTAIHREISKTHFENLLIQLKISSNLHLNVLTNSVMNSKP